MIKKNVNGTLKTVTNIRVPKKWKRFEYLESTGTQWIDTGYKPNPTTFSLESSFYVTNTTQSNVMGCRAVDGQYNGASLNMWIIDGEFRVDSTGYATSGPSINTSTKYAYTISPTKSTINGTAYNAVDKTNAYSPYSFILFGMKSGSDNASSLSYLKLYETKLYEGTILVRDFVPCEYNGQYGMWDLVENKFYGNKGTGTFKVGAEVKNYDEVEYIKRPNHLLHNGVELYDYLQFNITSDTFIETLYNPNVNTKLEVDWVPLGTTWALFGGSISGNTDRGIRLFYNGKLFAAFAGSRSESTVSLTANTRQVVEMSSGSLKINNTSYKCSSGGTFNPNLILGLDLAWDYGIHGANGKVYSFKIYEGTTLVRNFLPCTYFGVPGMWDTITNKFYGNSGTGEFKLGNKIELKEHEWRVDCNVPIYEKKNALVRESTAYIDTGVVANNNTKLVAEIQYTTLANSGRFGSYGSDGRFYFGMTSNQWAAAYSNGDSCNHSLGLADTNRHLFELNAEGFFIDGIKKYTSSPINFTSKIQLNCQALQGGSGSYKIYWFKIYKDNVLVRDFIPATLGGKPGLYDKVEHKMYYNANSSGSFTVE